MKKPQLPRRGTPAFITLTRLHALGGSAAVTHLAAGLHGKFNSITRLDREVIRPLIDIGFIKSVKAGVSLTPAGREYVESDAAPTSSGYVKTKAVVQTVEVKSLDLSKHMRVEERRPGALDYRQVPSLIGGQRVPFAVGNLCGRDGDSE